MTPKRRILSVLTKAELLEVGANVGVELSARSTVDELRDELAKSKRAGLDRILPSFSRDSLKAACSALGLISEGRENKGLIERILAAVEGRQPERKRPAAPLGVQAPLPIAGEAQPVVPAPKNVVAEEPPKPRTLPPVENELVLEVQPRKPRLAWQGMFRVPAVTSVPTQVVEIVRPARSSERKGELGLDTRVAPTRDLDEDPPNRLIWTNDNLVALKTLLDERDERTRDYKYRGKVDLVYIDPPFMVNSDFRADNAIDIELDDEEGVQAKKEPSLVEIIAYKDTWRQGLDSFLSMLRARLVLLKELLAPTGSIYVHLDWHTVHYVKAMMDEVFGYENFRNEVIWQRTSSHNDPGKYGIINDSILFYSLSETMYWGEPSRIPPAGYFQAHDLQKDETGRLFRSRDLTAPNLRFGETGKEWRGLQPAKKGRHWAVPVSELDELDAAGKIIWPERGEWPRLKVYLSEEGGVPVQSIWTDIGPVNSQAEQRLGYPTQKPVALLERVITASCPPRGLVIDCFMGSGTTAEAADRLGRRWIGIDNGKYATHLARKRLIQLHGQSRPAQKPQYDYVECEHCKNIERKEKSQKSPGRFEVKPFTVENMGAYQRAEAWQDFQLNRSKYREEMIKVFGGEPTNTSPLLHGKKGARWVHVGPLDAPVSEGQVWNIAREASKTSVKAVDILCADFDTLSASQKAAIEEKLGVHVVIRVIPSSAIDEVKRRVDAMRKDREAAIESMAVPAFYSPLAISLEQETKARVVRVTLDHCEVDIESFLASQRPAAAAIRHGMSPAAHKKAQAEVDRWEKRKAELEAWLKKAKSWQKFIDFWAVDFNYGHRVGPDGKPIFESDWQSFRTRRAKGDQDELTFTAQVQYPEPGRYQVAARVTDVFGNDGIATVTVEVA